MIEFDATSSSTSTSSTDERQTLCKKKEEEFIFSYRIPITLILKIIIIVKLQKLRKSHLNGISGLLDCNRVSNYLFWKESNKSITE